MLSRILGGGLLLSLVANGFLYARFEHAKLETQTLVSQAALAANQHWKETAFAMDAAHRAEVADLRNRLTLSDQVTKDSRLRAENAEANLRTFRGAQKSQAAQDTHYQSWAATPLPTGVADRLKALDGQ